MRKPYDSVLAVALTFFATKPRLKFWQVKKDVIIFFRFAAKFTQTSNLTEYYH